MRKTVTTITCDRCGEIVDDGGSLHMPQLIEFTKDSILPIAHKAIPMDLCPECYIKELEFYVDKMRTSMWIRS